LPQPRSLRERAGHARSFRETHRRRADQDGAYARVVTKSGRSAAASDACWGRTRGRRLFDIQIHAAENGVAQIAWKKVEKWRAWAQLSEGAYVLRTNVSGWSDEDLWRAYIQLTEAETAFRIQKSDLSLRPVWHQKEDRVLAHLLVCFLAYVLWKFLGQLCQQAGLGNEPRRVLDELSELRVVDVVLPTHDGHEIRTRCVTQPDDHQKILLERLGLALPGRLQKTEL
jgi:hypothetical protein